MKNLKNSYYISTQLKYNVVYVLEVSNLEVCLNVKNYFMNKGIEMKDNDGFSFVSYKSKRKRHQKEMISAPSVGRDSVDMPQNFKEIMKNIENELSRSDFISHFKKDLHEIFVDWELEYDFFTTDTNLKNMDSKNLLDSTQGLGRNTLNIDIVCYGLGQFSFCTIARYQLGFLLILKHILHSIHVHIYDPQFSLGEIHFLQELGLDVIGFNEEAKRTLEGRCVCFMPHCDLPLYNNLLWANWSVERLSKLVIIGNSFQSYELNDAKGHLKERAKYVYLANKFATEIKMANVFHFNDIFNDLSIHYFKSCSLSVMDPMIWTDLEEPEYSDEDNIIKNV